MNRRVARLGAALTLIAVMVLVASPAWAHVTANPGEAPKGGFAKIDFRVPNESDTAATISLEITFPTDTPIPSARVQPKAGWTATVETVTLDEPIDQGEGEPITEAVSKITWTGGRIEPGQFDEFAVSMGRLPEDADVLVFPTIQTYDDGEVARWIEAAPEGGEEPEFPAPTVRLVAGSDEHGGDDANESPTASAESDGSSDDGTDAISVIALVVGALGLVTAVAAIVLARRRA